MVQEARTPHFAWLGDPTCISNTIFHVGIPQKCSFTLSNCSDRHTEMKFSLTCSKDDAAKLLKPSTIKGVDSDKWVDDTTLRIKGDSPKETFHFEVALSGPACHYEITADGTNLPTNFSSVNIYRHMINEKIHSKWADRSERVQLPPFFCAFLRAGCDLA
jgi:hypothetical protein